MAKRSEAASQRTCVGCNRTADAAKMVRLVCSPEGTLELDLRRRLPGRGAWLCPSRDCFDAARNGRGFRRSLKMTTFTYDAEGLWNRLVRTNRERLMEDVRLALKAGAVVSGGNNVEIAFKRGNVCAVLVADDAAENSVQKFAQAAHAHGATVIRALTKDELGRVLGKEKRAAVAITHPAFAERLVRDVWFYGMIMNRPEDRVTRGVVDGEAAST